MLTGGITFRCRRCPFGQSKAQGETQVKAAQPARRAVAHTPAPRPAVALDAVVRAVYNDVGLEQTPPNVFLPGSTVITVDGSEKGGINFVNVGLRRRYSLLYHSQYGVHPIAVAKIKEKKSLNHMPLKCLLAQCQ